MKKIMIQMIPGHQKPIYSFSKRLLDVFLAGCFLVFLSSVYLIIAVAIKLEDPKGKILHISERVGMHGKIFDFYKFRTMCSDADEIYSKLQYTNETGGPTFKRKDDPRITKVGRFLRRTSLDELPQMVNILKGEMSFVGPRPPMRREVEEYPDYPMYRFSVKGGLSCYWQIQGRSLIDFNGMMELDFKYIEERGFITDLKILLLTIPAVLSGKGAY